MTGIYKITNPKGKVYIGQSIDIEKRFNQYRYLQSSQVKLYRSFKKYGFENHLFEVITECEFSELNELERYYQELYNVIDNGLNCVFQSTNEKKRVVTDEIRLKISKSHKGKYFGEKNPFYGKKHSADARKKMSEKRKGVKLPKEWAEKVIKNLEKTRGRKPTKEEIKKRVESFKANGYKPTREHMEKMWEKSRSIPWTDERRKKMSDIMKKRPPFSAEWRANIGAKSKGRFFSEETRLKMSKNSSKPSSKIVLHLETGIFFDSAKDAAQCFKIKHSTFKSNINGTNIRNKTGCIYA